MLTRKDIIRAWKDPEYRSNLSNTQLAQLPENPAGLMELTDAHLKGVVGARVAVVTFDHLWSGCRTVSCNGTSACTV